MSFFSTLTCVNSFPDVKVDYYSIEKQLLPKSIFETIYKNHPNLHPYIDSFLKQYDPEKRNTIQTIKLTKNIELHLIAYDVSEAIEKFHIKTDIWYLDGFSPTKNPEMWSPEIFEYIKSQSKKDSSFATYSTSRLVKDGLVNAGFTLSKKKGFGSKREFLTGIRTKKSYSIDRKSVV